MLFAHLPLIYVMRDGDSLPLRELHKGMTRDKSRIGSALDNCTLNILWNNRGMWGLIPKATVTNVLKTYRDFEKLRGVYKDRPPKLAFNWNETIPVSSPLGRILASTIRIVLEQRKQLGETISATDSTTGGKTD